MRAAHKYGVKRVVITSSMAAIFEGYPEDERPEMFDESNWSKAENLT